MDLAKEDQEQVGIHLRTIVPEGRTLVNLVNSKDVMCEREFTDRSMTSPDRRKV